MLKVGQKIRIKPEEYFEGNYIKFYQQNEFIGYCEENSVYFLPLNYINDTVYKIEAVEKMYDDFYYKIDNYTWVKEDWVEKI